MKPGFTQEQNSKNMERKIKFTIRKMNKADREWAAKFLKEHWGSEKIISRGRVYYLTALSGFVAINSGKYLGLATYIVEKKECQITSLNSIVERKGVGTALVERVKKEAKKLKCKRLWLTTTNDDIDALRFYQRRGLSFKKIYPGAVTSARKKLKPEIPLIGDYGIPIKDEIEFEIVFK